MKTAYHVRRLQQLAIIECVSMGIPFKVCLYLLTRTLCLLQSGK